MKRSRDMLPIAVKPLVSVVINNYNYGCFVRAAIESALQQRGCFVEVIVVDDGSTDDSRNVIASFGTRISAIFKENGGQASAINVGVARAKGEYILLLDSDDVLRPEAVETGLANFEPGYSRIAWQLREIDEEGRPLSQQPREHSHPSFDGDAIESYIKSGRFPIIPTSGNLFLARDLRAIMPIPENRFRISADIPVLIATAERGRVRILAERLTDYRIHGRNNYYSKGMFFDAKKMRAQLAAEIDRRELLGDAARRRDTAFSPPPIAARLATALRILLAQRMGIMKSELADWTPLQVIGAYWAFASEPVLRRLVGVLILGASTLLPLPSLQAVFALRARAQNARGLAPGDNTTSLR